MVMSLALGVRSGFKTLSWKIIETLQVSVYLPFKLGIIPYISHKCQIIYVRCLIWYLAKFLGNIVENSVIHTDTK